MNSELFDFIKTLTELSGPIGQEAEVLDYIEPIWQAAGAKTRRTRIGNLLGHGGGQGKKLLLVAHADELCYLVRSITAGGFMMLANGQAWERKTSMRNWYTIGQRVTVLARSGPIPGVIGSASGHSAALMLPEPTELTWNDFWVDTGLSREELIARGVTPGTRIIWDAETTQFGQHIVGKALDDRVPIAAITEVLRRVPIAERAWNVTVACTIQEEIGIVGAYALAAREQFDAAIVVEIGLAGDIPTVNDVMIPVRLGAGPILVHKDSLVHYNHQLVSALEQTAVRVGIPIQHAVFGSFGSDGAALTKGDIPASMLAFPARYTHSAFETGHMGDIDALIDLMCAFVRGS